MVTMKKIGFFEEAEGVKSSTRLNSFLMFLFLSGFDVMLAQAPEFTLDYNFILFNVVGLTAVFAPKYFHKIAETKLETIKK